MSTPTPPNHRGHKGTPKGRTTEHVFWHAYIGTTPTTDRYNAYIGWDHGKDEDKDKDKDDKDKYNKDNTPHTT